MTRSGSAAVVVNFLAFKAGWIICVLGATEQMPWLGPIWVLSWITAFFIWQKQHWMEWIFLLAAAAIGYCMDSILVLTGLIEFPLDTQFGAPSPLWMTAMWLNMAGAIRYALGWLRGKYMLSASVGLIFGPLAYLAGQKLGGINLVGGVIPIALEWLIAMPLLLYLEIITRPKQHVSNNTIKSNS